MTIIKLGDLVEVLETNNNQIRGMHLVLDKIDEEMLDSSAGPFFVDKVPDYGDDDKSGYETTFTTYGWAQRIRLTRRGETGRARYDKPTSYYPNRVEVDDDGKFVRAWKSTDETQAQDAVAVEEDTPEEVPAPALLPVGAHVVIKRATWAEESEGNTGVIQRNDAPHNFTDMEGVNRPHPYRIKEDNTGRTIYAAEVELVSATQDPAVNGSNEPPETPQPLVTDPETDAPLPTLGEILRTIMRGGKINVEPPQIVSMGIITPDGKMQEMTPEELAARGVSIHGATCDCEDPGALPDGEPDLYQRLIAAEAAAEANRHDPVHHPSHYTGMPNGIECIDVIEWMNLCRGNAIKYIWRAGQKDPSKEIEDLEKAVWYLNREIDRLRRVQR